MDGADLDLIDQIDEDAFVASQTDTDEDDCDLPMPDCIGLDSAIQDAEKIRKEFESHVCKSKSRSELERELELRMLKPNSIRRQILERSINEGNNKIVPCGPDCKEHNKSSSSNIRVMNISEKAGMVGIDKDKINQIIQEASKGSLFYKRQAQRQSEIHKSIEKMLNRVNSSSPEQIENARLTCDRLMQDLERQRVFNRIIVHFDLDMFFAAVEIRDNPDLADKPVAVGGESMVSTSNYIARRFGVRAAMPGFIAKKLCPQLVLIKPNGFKYRQASSEVFSILEKYDPELASMSLDEAYLDLTEYVKNSLEKEGHDETLEIYDATLPKIWWTRAREIVEEIRQAIYDKTKLTCSAGIACNTLLAKISTDINKPNGYYMVEGYNDIIQDFINKTPVEKVSGIGKVSSQFLNALDIKTCGDIYEKRHFLPLVFYEINVKFYLRVAIGDGSITVKSDEHRKSKSVERTFPAIKDTLMLLDKLDNICEELCSKYLRPYRIRGRTVTIKLKRNTFTTTTKSYSMLVATNDKSVIYSAAKNLLLSEVASEPPEISYRLLGVKISNLADDGVATNQLTIDAMLRNHELSRPPRSDTTVHCIEHFEPAENKDVCRESILTKESDFKTQEDQIEVFNKLDVQYKTDASTSKSFSQKRRKTQKASIELLCKRVKKSSPDADGSSSQSPHHDRGSHFFHSQDDENIEATTVTSQEHQTDLNFEEFQCPYCFKSFIDFCKLEDHVSTCNYKTAFDPNKTLVSQRPATSKLSTPLSKAKIRVKSSGARTPKCANQVEKLASSQSLASQLISPSNSSIEVNDTQNSKTSFYQKFIESNSQSLMRSGKVEPFQCPHCFHGFFTFESLDSHVSFCNKQNKSSRS